MTDNKWNRLPARPPSLFLGPHEQDFTKQVSAELVEKVVGQQVLYHCLDIEHSNYNLYGECIKKIYLPPVHIYCRVTWEGSETIQDQTGIDRIQTITIHFHSRRLTEDQELYIQEGDVVFYSDQYYEIVEVNENQEIFGQHQFMDQVECKCRKVREDFFNG